MKHRLQLSGRFRYERWHNETIVARHVFYNGITTPGINALLDGDLDLDDLKIGLIDNASFSALSAADTMASHAGWIENTDYDEAARPDWGAAAATSGIKQNTTSVVFTFNAAVTIKGLFLTTNATKGGATGTLWSTGLLPTADSPQIGSVGRVFYDLTGREG